MPTASFLKFYSQEVKTEGKSNCNRAFWGNDNTARVPCLYKKYVWKGRVLVPPESHVLTAMDLNKIKRANFVFGARQIQPEQGFSRLLLLTGLAI